MESGEPQDLPVSLEEAEGWVAKLEEKGEAKIAQDRGQIGPILGNIYFQNTSKVLRYGSEGREHQAKAELFENLYRGMPLVQAHRHDPESISLYVERIRNSGPAYQSYLERYQKELYLGDLVAQAFEDEHDEQSEKLDFEGRYHLLMVEGGSTRRGLFFLDAQGERLVSGFVPNEASEAASKDRKLIERVIEQEDPMSDKIKQ
jgi:hypothetical protein